MKKYEALELEVISFDSNDVILTSFGDTDGQEVERVIEDDRFSY